MINETFKPLLENNISNFGCHITGYYENICSSFVHRLDTLILKLVIFNIIYFLLSEFFNFKNKFLIRVMKIYYEFIVIFNIFVFVYYFFVLNNIDFILKNLNQLKTYLFIVFLITSIIYYYRNQELIKKYFKIVMKNIKDNIKKGGNNE